MSTRTIVTKVVNAVLYNDGTVLVQNVRWSYPHLLVPKGGVDAKGVPIPPSYSLVGMMPKDTHAAAKDLLKEVIKTLLAANKLIELPAKQLFLTSGDEAGKSPGKEMYKGHYLFSCREKAERPPSIRDVDGRTKLGASDAGRVYGGCYGNVLIKPWFQNNNFGKRVNAGLVAAQFLRDGVPFGEGRITEETLDDTFADESSDDVPWATPDNDEL